jgi:hypothetical protein
VGRKIVDMGVMIEINTLLRVAKGTNSSDLKVGGKYSATAPRERIVPLHIAILMIDENWQFLGYCVVHSTDVGNQQTVINYEVLSLFTKEERKTYTARFLEATKKTGEIK